MYHVKVRRAFRAVRFQIICKLQSLHINLAFSNAACGSSDSNVGIRIQRYLQDGLSKTVDKIICADTDTKEVTH